MSLYEYKGNLLEANVDAIVHQTNCYSNTWSGLAASIFESYPQANTYLVNPRPNMFGCIERTMVNDAPFKVIINLFGQMYPGKAKHPNDTAAVRLDKFAEALARISTIAILAEWNSIAFPKYIGCGLAGGNWSDYRFTLVNFAAENPEVDVHIIER